MADVFTEVEHEGFLSRAGNSFGGILVGIVLIISAVIGLFWNEGRAVKRARDLAEGKGNVITLDANTVDPANEGKLVHLSAKATTNEELQDSAFGIAENALRLIRTVEMYQWKERVESRKRKNTGGSTTTTKTYHYERTWSESAINSNSFRKPEEHHNPTDWPATSTSFTSNTVTCGAFSLPDRLVNRIDAREQLTLTQSLYQSLPQSVRSEYTLQGSHLFRASNEGISPIGDLRVSWSIVRPQIISLVSRQSGNSFVPYTAASGGTVELLATGAKTAEDLFTAAEAENATWTWIIRGIGFVVMLIGFGLLFGPIQVLADVLPIVRDIVGFGIGLISFVLSLALSLTVIAVGWVFYRPLIGIPLLALAIALPIALAIIGKQRGGAAS